MTTPPGGDAGLRSEALTVSVSDHAATGPVFAQTTPHYPRVLTRAPAPRRLPSSLKTGTRRPWSGGPPDWVGCGTLLESAEHLRHGSCLPLSSYDPVHLRGRCFYFIFIFLFLEGAFRSIMYHTFWEDDFEMCPTTNARAVSTSCQVCFVLFSDSHSSGSLLFIFGLN